MSRVRVLQGANLKIKDDNMNESNQTLNSIKTYFKGVKTEWGKISWPERKQVAAETLSVIFIVFMFTVAIYFIDLVFKFVLGFINK